MASDAPDVEGEEVAGTLLASAGGELAAALPGERLAELEELEQAMVEYAAASRADNTLRAYTSDWNQFAAWCARYELTALRAWLDASGMTSGPVFRRVTRTGAVSSPLSAQSVALIVKRRVQAAGFDSSAFAGHSLRSGFATQAARDGYRLADVTRHPDQRVLDGYIEAGKGAEHVAWVL